MNGIAFKDGQKLNRGMLYYLCHPLTTYGSVAENRLDAEQIEKFIYSGYGIHVLNTLAFPLPRDEDHAMDKCLKMLTACDGIILCPCWEKSRGCCVEESFAEMINIEILEIIIF